MTENGEKLRVAAVGDLHVREGEEGHWRKVLAQMAADADVVVLTGDLTNRGAPREAEILAAELQHYTLPVVGVLGNHDHELGQVEEVQRILCGAGLRMLAGGEPVEIGGVGFAGVKGFAGGFDRNMLEPWGEEIIKKFVYETVNEALGLEGALASIRAERKIAVLHYAPIRDTVVGEPEAIFPYLGSSRLIEPICRFDVAAVFHGHAHRGSPQGTAGNGIPVYNVSLPLMEATCPERPYVVVEV